MEYAKGTPRGLDNNQKITRFSSPKQVPSFSPWQNDTNALFDCSGNGYT